MKKIVLVFVLFIGLTLFGCKKKPIDPIIDDPIEVTSVALDKKAQTLFIGDTVTLRATVLPENATDKGLTWVSSDEAIATVSATGTVSAVSVGEATITVSSKNEITDTFVVTVVSAEQKEGYHLYADFDDNLVPPFISKRTSGGGAIAVENGILKMETVGTGEVMGTFAFAEALSGTVVAETRFMSNSTAFTNVLFFYTGGINTSDIVATLAFENNQIKYHDGGGWKNIMPYESGRYYDIKMVLNIGDRSLNPNKGMFDLFIDGRKIGSYTFRNGGDGFEDNIYRLEFGSTKANSEFAYDYLYIYNSVAPTLTLLETQATLDLEVSSTYEVKYNVTGSPDPVITITSSAPTGYVVNENIITFTAAGTYLFRVEAQNGAGIDEKELTIVVTGDQIAPTLRVSETMALVNLADDPTYTLSYEVTGGNPEPVVSITADKEVGYTLLGDAITFTEVGTYNFKITATNAAGSVFEFVEITVIDGINVLNEDFTGEPAYEITKQGTGSVTYIDGVMNIQSAGSANSAFVAIPFGHVLTNSYVIDTKVKVEDPAFSNALFVYANNRYSTSDIIAAVAFEAGNIRYHNGSTWVTIMPYTLDVWYELTMVMNVETTMFELLVDGVSKGHFPFRNPGLAKQGTHLYLGSDKTGTNMSHDYIKVTYASAPTVSLTETTASVDIDVDATYTIDYTVLEGNPTSKITISATPAVGFTLVENVVTFTAVGTYTFKVEVFNGVYSVFDEVVITVTGNQYAPIVNIIEEHGLVNLSKEDTYTLNYTITPGNPEEVVTITSDKESGYTLSNNVVTFTEAGLYTFTIKAENSVAAHEGVIVVEALETSAFIDDEFTTLNPDYTITTKGTGSVVVENDKLVISAQGSDNSAFVKIPFGRVLEDKVIFEMLYTPNSNAFSNFFFIYSKNSNALADIAIAIATENGNFKHHDGSWKNIKPFTIGQQYDIKVIIDVNADTYLLYIDDLFIGDFAYRVPANKDLMTHLYIGSDKTGAIMTYDSLKVSFADNLAFELTEDTATLDLNITNTYQVLYTNGLVYPESIITIEAQEGFTVSGNVLTFTKAGMYTIEVKAFNYVQTIIETLTITVLEANEAPQIDITYQEAEVNLLFDPTHTLTYTVSGFPKPEVVISGLPETGYTISGDVITFSEVGTYTFTITATNSVGSVTKDITISVVSKSDPVILIEYSTQEVNLFVDATHELVYTVTGDPTPTVDITLDALSGYTLDGNTLTFSEVGIYTVTITATNTGGTATKDVVITVVNEFAPIVTINQSNELVILSKNPELTLNYTITHGNPLEDVTITGFPLTGYTLTDNVVTFTEAGTYTFNIHAENIIGMSEGTITVIVESSEVIINDDFDLVSTFTPYSGQSAIIYAENGELFIKNPSPAVRAIAYYQHMFEGAYAYSARIKYHVLDTREAAYAFLMYKNTTDINIGSTGNMGAAVIFLNNSIQAYDSVAGKWVILKEASMDTYYDLQVSFNMNTETYLVSIDGDTYGPFKYRNSLTDFGVLAIGSNRPNIDIVVDSLKLERIYVPSLTLNNTSEEILLVDGSASVVLDYEINEFTHELEVVVDSNNYTYDSLTKTITFSDVGVYNVTLRAQSILGIVEQSIVITVNEAPRIEINYTEAEVNLALDATHTFVYQVFGTPTPETIIKTTSETGYSLLDNAVTFSEEGVYVFTITATNSVDTISREITLTVVTKNEPTLDVGYTTAEVNIATDATHTLVYEALGDPNPTTSIEVTPSTGYTLSGDTLTFTEVGTYTVTITATNINGSESKDITINVINELAPTISIEYSEAVVDLRLTNTHTLTYSITGAPEPTVVIETANTSGYSIVDNVITFTEEGTFVFTITATNSQGSDTKVVSIDVVTTALPEITVNEATPSINLVNDSHVILDYSVIGSPIPTTEISVDKLTGYTKVSNTELAFYETGVYLVTVTATNSVGVDSKTITITVNDESVENYIYINEFDTLPEGLTFTNGATGTVADGILTLQTTASGKALFGAPLLETPSGVIVYETRYKVATPLFQNVALIYAGSANVLGIAVQEGTIRYQNGSTWFNTHYAAPVGEWITIKAVVYLGEGVFDMYVNGVKHTNLSLRTKGVAENQLDKLADIGIDNRINSTMEFDYIRMYRLSPEVIIEPSYTLTLDTLTLSLENVVKNGIPYTMTLTGSNTGYTFENETITFTEAGEYTFTLDVTTTYTTVSKTFAVSVIAGEVAPEITVVEDTASIDLQETNVYELLYSLNVANPEATLTISSAPAVSISDNVATFSEVGTYVFTLRYENINAFDEKTITVNVTNSGHLINDDFDVNSSHTIYTTGSPVENYVYVENGELHIKNPATAVRATAYYRQDFDGSYLFSSRVKSMITDTAEPAYVFLMYADTTTINIATTANFGAAVITQNNKFKAYDRNVGSWVELQDVVAGQYYDMSVSFNHATESYFVTIDGVTYGSFKYRNSRNDFKVIAFGSNRPNLEVVLDSVKIEKIYAPVLSLINVDETIGVSSVITLDYSVVNHYDALHVEVETGYLYDEVSKQLTFTEVGVYQIPIKAYSAAGESIKMLTITVE